MRVIHSFVTRVVDEIRNAGIVQVVSAIAAVAAVILAVAFDAGGGKIATLGLKLNRDDLEGHREFRPGDEVRYTARVRNVSSEEIHELGVTGRTPPGISLLPGSCVVVFSSSLRKRCESDSDLVQAHISSLNAGDAVHIHVTGRLRAGIGEHNQVAVFEATSEETAAKKGVVALTPSVPDDLASYQDFYRREIEGQLQWQAESLRKAASRDLLVGQWQRLTPYGQHSFSSIRPELRVSLKRLFESEALAGKILGFTGSVTNAPLEGKVHRTVTKEQVALQRVPLGGQSERVWCSTTLPADRLIEKGDRLEVVGVIVAWGNATPYGRPEPGVMLICPAIRRVGGIGTAVQRIATGSGGTEVPEP